jgi:hypothetical protein
MKLTVIVLVIMFCFSCDKVVPSKQRQFYLGQVKEFSLHGGGFLSRPTVIIKTEDGNKYTCVLYKEIAIGDSLFDGSIGIVWSKAARQKIKRESQSLNTTAQGVPAKEQASSR